MCGVSRLYIFAAYMVLKHSDRKERGGGEGNYKRKWRERVVLKNDYK